MDQQVKEQMTQQLTNAIAEAAYDIADHCDIPSYLVPLAVIRLACDQWIGATIQDMQNPAAKKHFQDFRTALQGMVLSTLNDFADAVQRGGELDAERYPKIDKSFESSFADALKGCTEYGHKMALMYAETKGNA